jgi:GNAT superfamily N-acetyltransferase
MIVRDPRPEDEAAWRKLWAGYVAFYEATVPEETTDHTWRRILDPASTVFARLADEDGAVTGFAVGVRHEGTWRTSPVCYLEDLFVDQSRRGRGIGRALIRDMVETCRRNGWAELYWHTRQGNPARRLYDEFVEADDFVRYRLALD